jgi:hypothetical protein
MPEPHLRASDNDRAAVASALGEHMAAGRLTLAEYEDRLTHVYETKTLGGLAELTADLPPTAAAPLAPAPTYTPAARGHGCSGSWAAAGHSSWRSWATTASIVLTVWLVLTLTTGTAGFFWPIWVIGPWGAMLLARTVSGGGRDRNRDRHRSRDSGERPRIRA